MSNELSRIAGDALPDDLPQPISVENVLGGVHALWRFPNGQGASVINQRDSYGTELAVLRFFGEGVEDYNLDYSTPLTSDVIGYLSGPEQLIGLLRKIRDLPPAQLEEDDDAVVGAILINRSREQEREN